MSSFKLRPMPEICLIDPLTGELPKNYKQILAQQQKSASSNAAVNGMQDVKETNSKSQFKLQPMPEIFLIDPNTGELPKNYKQLLAQKQKKDAPSDDCDQPSSKKKKKSFELKPMPELALIDPVTGELPKNYKQILTRQGKNDAPSNPTGNNFRFTKPTAITEKPKLSNLQFKVSKVAAKENIPKKVIPDSTGQTDIKSKGVRKVLFRDIDKRKSRVSGVMRTRALQVQNKSSSIEINDTLPLLDMEESGSELLVFKRKSKVPRKMLPLPSHTSVQKILRSAGKQSMRSSSSSIDEFLKFEQQCKTPKSIIKTRRRRSANHPKHIDNITKKISEIKALHKEIDGKNKEIVEKTMKIQENWNEILHSLNLVGQSMSENINFNGTENEENSQPQHSQSSINPLANETTLRISTLRKNLQRKVLFNLNENEMTTSPRVRKNSQTISKTIATPNTMIKSMKKIADEQYMQLKDTPKSLH